MILTVEVKPNARENKIIAWKDRGTVVVAIKAPPIDGKANLELIQFLAKTFKIPKTRIEIVRGQTARIKHVRIPDQMMNQG